MDLVLFSTPSRNRIISDFSSIDLTELKMAIRNKLSEELIDPFNDIFTLEPNNAHYIIYQWAGPLLVEKEIVERYLDQVFLNNPTRITLFLSGYLKSNPLSENNEEFSFDVERFNKTFDIDWILKWNSKIILSEDTPKKEKIAVFEFKKNIQISTKD